MALFRSSLIAFTVPRFLRLQSSFLVYAAHRANGGVKNVALHQLLPWVSRGQEDERSRISLELHDTVARTSNMWRRCLSEQLYPASVGRQKAAGSFAGKIQRMLTTKCIQVNIARLCYNLHIAKTVAARATLRRRSIIWS